jgi:carbonic anhydrase
MFTCRTQCHVSRREMFGLTAAGLAAVTGDCLLADEPAERPIGPSSPHEALKLLYVGNERFAAGRAMLSAHPGPRIGDSAAPRSPFAAMLACADMHLPAEVIFDQGFGDLYVARVAGNVAALDEVASLEFGVNELGARLVYVLGHAGCGAMQAALSGSPADGPMAALFARMRPALKAAAGDMDEAVRDNVRQQMNSLLHASRAVADGVEAGTLVLAGGVFDPTTGRVDPVDLS